MGASAHTSQRDTPGVRVREKLGLIGMIRVRRVERASMRASETRRRAGLD